MTDSDVPGPPGHWLTGNLPLLKRDILSLLEELPRAYGDVVRLRFGGYRALLLSHPAHIEEILVTQGANFEKPSRFRRIVRTAFGNGIFAAEGTAWQQQRSLLQSVVGALDPQRHCATVQTTAEGIVDSWRDGDRSDLAKRMVDLALAIRAKTALGIDRVDTLSSIHDALDGFMAYYTSCLRSPLQWPLWVPTASNRRMSEALAILSRSIRDQIDRAREASHPEDTLVSRLMARASTDALSPPRLRDELATWLLTGTETTANTLAWTCYLLAKHPDRHEQLLSAIDGAREAGRQGDALRHTPLGSVLAESMRLYPQAYLIGRKAKAPFTIAGRTFPANTTVILNQWSIGRDPRWYAEPLSFDPDRWNADTAGRRPAFAYFPFGGGARACLGRRLSTLELPLLLAMVVRRFRFDLMPGASVRPIASLTLRPLFEQGAIVMRRR